MHPRSRKTVSKPSTPLKEAENENAGFPEAGSSLPYFPFSLCSHSNKPPPFFQKSSYQYRSPRFDRGPLHPIQPPPPSDPSSRRFIPGPFSLPRLQQTYTSTLAPDLLTLFYKHHPPGTLPGPTPPRLRTWEGDSPYFKNRPLRAPRGGPVLNLLERPITFRNVPTLSKIHVHTFVRDAVGSSAPLHVASMALQAITNVRCEVFQAKKSIAAFGNRAGKAMAVGCELRDENMWCFLSKLVDVVMPRIKDYKGVSGRSGDGNGNLGWGYTPDIVGMFPEIEINYDSSVLVFSFIFHPSPPLFFSFSISFFFLLLPSPHSSPSLFQPLSLHPFKPPISLSLSLSLSLSPPKIVP